MKRPGSKFLAYPLYASRMTFAERVRRYCFFILWTALFGALVWGIGLFWRCCEEFAGESRLFKIENIRIDGADAELEGRILERIEQIADADRGNLFRLDMERARRRIEDLPRVRTARLEKGYPNTLRVSVTRRQPLVAAIANGGFYWLDVEGVILGPASTRQVADLNGPLLTGLSEAGWAAGATMEQPLLDETLQTIAFLEQYDPELAGRFAEWNLDPDGEVRAILREGVEVIFGPVHPVTRMAALKTVLRQKKDLTYIPYFDLRYEADVPIVVYRDLRLDDEAQIAGRP
jgi:cell division protein FtsQ